MSGRRGLGSSWAGARVIAALLAVGALAACGGGSGGGVSNVQQQQPQPQPPQLSTLLSPGALAFGTFQLGYTSSSQTANLVNSGGGAINITAINISGDFAQTNNCPSSLAIGAGCLFYLTFAPTATGARTGSLSVTTSASTTPQAISLSGTGITISTQVSTANLAFNSQNPGTTSAGQPVILSNTGTVPITVAISTTGNFGETDNCGGGVNVGASCTITVTFSPTAPGTSNGFLNIAVSSSGQAGPAQVVGLSGTGTAAQAGFSSTTLTFPSQFTTSTSAAQTETITNTGIAALSITAVAIGGTNAGDFQKTADTCSSASVAPNTSCTVKVTFTPAAVGSRTGSLIFTDNAPGSPQTVALIGTGEAAQLSFSASTLTFVNQTVNTTSPTQTVNVSNTGAASINISTVVISGTSAGDFAKSTDTCSGSTLTAKQSCTVKVTFTPPATGTVGASLIFTDGAPGSPQTVNLSGTGTSSLVSFATPAFSFPNQLINTASAAITETVTNTGAGNLTISSVGISGTNDDNFTKTTDTCTGATVTPTKTCVVKVTFSPSATQAYNASLNFTDNAPGSPQTVPLSGTGTAPLVSFFTPSLTFAGQPTGTISAAQTEIVTNAGTGNLVISSVAIKGKHASYYVKSSDTCSGTPVLPHGTCTVGVEFTPFALGSLSATLNFTDNAPDSPQIVPLSGTGTQSLVGMSAPVVTFAAQAISTTSTAVAETVTNNATSNLIISTVTLGGTNASEFAKTTDTCTGATLIPGNTCTVDMKFTPGASGIRNATLNFADNAAASPQFAELTGLGIGPLAGVYTQRYDNMRTGQNTQETYLTASNVTEDECGAHPQCFGKVFTLPVDGAVYAQPLYMENVTVPNLGAHNVVFVATEHDSVFAFDADGQSTAPLWQVSFLSASASVTTVPCTDVYGTGGGNCDIAPEIGITSTPVIDPVGGTIYLTAKTREPLGSNPSCTENASLGYDYCYRLHALDITTGTEKFGGPVVITASVPGTGYDNVKGTITFSAFRELQRPGLLLLNGTLYIAFGSHGDNSPYHGWLMAYNPTTLALITTFCTTPNGHQGAIWHGGGGIAADSSSPPNLYIVVANGTFDGNVSGGQDWGDTVLKMQLVSGQFKILDYFTPANQAELAEDDLDLGSSPALVLPDQPGSHPHLLAIGGKDGRLWLLNRDSLGGYTTNDAGALQVIPPPGGDALFGGGAYWNGNLYFQEVGTDLDQYMLEPDDGTMSIPPSSSTYGGGYPNAVPAVSSNGTSNGVLWAVGTYAANHNGPAELHVFNATDVSLEQIYTTAQAPDNHDQMGPAVKFVVPTIANGKVYIGAVGEVDVYGLLP